MHVLENGFLEAFNGRIALSREARLAFGSGARRFNRSVECEHCGTNCMATFEGRLILGIGLNNSLKGL